MFRKSILKNIVTLWVVAIFVLCNNFVVKAESQTAQDYMEHGIRAAYDNMHLIYEGYYDADDKLEVQPAGHVAMYQEWDADWNLISRTYLGTNGEPVNRVDGYSKVEWKKDKNGIRTISFYDTDDKEIPGVNILLLTDIKSGNDGWSEWLEPKPDTENCTFLVGYTNLGEKKEGDQYTCSVEIEVTNVVGVEGKNFWFRAQGDVDQSWGIGNIWNDGLVSLREPPEDNVYRYTFTSEINESMAEANIFSLGFRCDYWQSGKFRIRNINIEKE